MQALIIQGLLKAGQRPTSVLKSLGMGATAGALAAGVRALASPILGTDVSFITAIPAVLLATFFGGAWAGSATIVIGSGLDLLISSQGGGAALASATPRLVVWLSSAGVSMAITLQLREALNALRLREADLVKAKTQLQLLNRELEHRGRNALTIVSALSNEVSRSASSVWEYRQTLGGRLNALATSYSALTRTTVGPVALPNLVQTVLKPFGRQIEIENGGACEVSASASLCLSLALHELATNATKYGALSDPAGRVGLKWTLGAEDRLTLNWVETGGPPPKAGMRGGFGSTLLQSLFRDTPNGSFKSIWRPEGMSFQMTAQTSPPTSEPSERQDRPKRSLRAANENGRGSPS